MAAASDYHQRAAESGAVVRRPIAQSPRRTTCCPTAMNPAGVQYIDSDASDPDLTPTPSPTAPTADPTADPPGLTDPEVEPVGPEVPLCPAGRAEAPPVMHASVVCLRVRAEVGTEVGTEVSGRTACFRILSVVYAKLLVVVCIAFLMSEIVTNHVPLYFYEVYFTYLYSGSILFLLYVSVYLIHEGSSSEDSALDSGCGCCGESIPSPMEVSVSKNGSQVHLAKQSRLYQSRLAKTSYSEHGHGGFFVRIGAIAFGLGTMVYNGIELGTFFELPRKSPCWKVLLAVNPCLQTVFTFMQMYFIFMNPRLDIHKFKVVAWFGLMHVVGANICVWIRTLVRESLWVFIDYSASTGDDKIEDFMILVNRLEVSSNLSCNRSNIMGNIVSSSSPYLFPLIVEFSLIGATMLYVVWKNIGRCQHYVENDITPDHISISSRKVHNKVDCVGASKGLFCGLLVLAVSIVCLVLFFVLVHREQHRQLAIFLSDTPHSCVLCLMVIGSLVGFVRSRRLKFAFDKPAALDAMLLRVSGFGLLLYSMFCLIAAALSPLSEIPNILVLVTSSLVIVQVLVQLVYISDVSKRSIHLAEHDRTKPGRQVVTFMLMCNLALWVVYTFEIEKVDANPVQLNFYGHLHWAVILRLTLPLAIFHRFHCAVVLAEVWKSGYRARAD